MLSVICLVKFRNTMERGISTKTLTITFVELILGITNGGISAKNVIVKSVVVFNNSTNGGITTITSTTLFNDERVRPSNGTSLYFKHIVDIF